MVGGSEDSDGFVGVCRTNGPVSAADILANMKDSKFREEKVGKYTIHTKNKASFCVAQKDLILFGPSTTIQETLLRKGPPELSTGLQTAIRAADFSKGVVTVANAKDILRKGSRLDSTRIAGLSQELADAVIRATAAGVLEITFGKAIEWRVQVCCKDAATARELKKLNDEANTKAEADPNTSKQDLKILASERWSQDESRLIGTGKIDVETVVELIDQYRKKESQRADQERFKLNIGHNRKEEQHPKKGVR